MKVVFCSNYLNHHQLPFCLAMDRMTKGNFTFVATTPVPDFRRALGYHDMNKEYSFVLTTYDSAENQAAAIELALAADALITGAAPEIYSRERIRRGKLVFRYSERLFKGELRKALRLRTIAAGILRHARFAFKPVYMLCASAYTAFDFALSGAYLGKTYKWGYFPALGSESLDELFARKRGREKISLMWAGRMIEWKHPEVIVQIAERLKADGYDFDFSVIGSGELEAWLQSEIEQKGLKDCVQLCGALSPEAVREHMEATDIFIFSSDFNEGWGVVLNESMSSGCAVIASHAIGSVPFLVENGENGLIYRNGNIDELYQRVKYLMDSPEERERLGRNAYATLAETWNAEVTAERFLQLAENLLAKKKETRFADGPCSPAKIITNRWYKGAKDIR